LYRQRHKKLGVADDFAKLLVRASDLSEAMFGYLNRARTRSLPKESSPVPTRDAETHCSFVRVFDSDQSERLAVEAPEVTDRRWAVQCKRTPFRNENSRRARVGDLLPAASCVRLAKAYMGRRHAPWWVSGPRYPLVSKL
jgi:hypothetical protein